MDIGAEICRAIKKEERGCGYQDGLVGSMMLSLLFVLTAQLASQR